MTAPYYLGATTWQAGDHPAANLVYPPHWPAGPGPALGHMQPPPPRGPPPAGGRNEGLDRYGLVPTGYLGHPGLGAPGPYGGNPNPPRQQQQQQQQRPGAKLVKCEADFGPEPGDCPDKAALIEMAKVVSVRVNPDAQYYMRDRELAQAQEQAVREGRPVVDPSEMR